MSVPEVWHEDPEAEYWDVVAEPPDPLGLGGVCVVCKQQVEPDCIDAFQLGCHQACYRQLQDRIQAGEIVPAKGSWVVTPYDETFEKIQSCKSWALHGVFRSLAKRAKSSGVAKGVDRDEVAAEAGCGVKQVSTAYGVLATITVREVDGTVCPLLRKLEGGHQGKCSTFEVRGYVRKGRQYPKRLLGDENAEE